MYYDCVTYPHNGHLFTTATFLCPQGVMREGCLFFSTFLDPLLRHKWYVVLCVNYSTCQIDHGMYWETVWWHCEAKGNKRGPVERQALLFLELVHKLHFQLWMLWHLSTEKKTNVLLVIVRCTYYLRSLNKYIKYHLTLAVKYSTLLTNRALSYRGDHYERQIQGCSAFSRFILKQRRTALFTLFDTALFFQQYFQEYFKMR